MSTATCKGNLLRNHSLVAKILDPGVTGSLLVEKCTCDLPRCVEKLGPRVGDQGVSRAQSNSWEEVRCPSPSAVMECRAETVCCSPTASSGAVVSVSPLPTVTFTAS